MNTPARPEITPPVQGYTPGESGNDPSQAELRDQLRASPHAVTPHLLKHSRFSVSSALRCSAANSLPASNRRGVTKYPLRMAANRRKCHFCRYHQNAAQTACSCAPLALGGRMGRRSGPASAKRPKGACLWRSTSRPASRPARRRLLACRRRLAGRQNSLAQTGFLGDRKRALCRFVWKRAAALRV
jgi:hypothetical protein